MRRREQALKRRQEPAVKESSPGRPDRFPDPPGASRLLALQRAAGNRAVLQLLQRKTIYVDESGVARMRPPRPDVNVLPSGTSPIYMDSGGVGRRQPDQAPGGAQPIFMDAGGVGHRRPDPLNVLSPGTTPLHVDPAGVSHRHPDPLNILPAGTSPIYMNIAGVGHTKEQVTQAMKRERAQALAAGRLIDQVYRLRRQVSARLQVLGLSDAPVIDTPYPEEGSRRLDDPGFATCQANTSAEAARLNALLLALRAASWTADSVDDDAFDIRLGQVDALLATPPLDAATVGAAVRTLNGIAETARVRSLVRAQFDAVAGDPPTNNFHKRLMQGFAADHNLSPDRWTVYQSLFKEVANERKEPPAPPNGKMNIAALNLATTGGTAGQRYWPPSGNRHWHSYAYHLSASFSVFKTTATITKVHVTFEGPGTPRYWWNVSNGALTPSADHLSGSGHSVAMAARAKQLVNDAAPKLNLRPLP